VKVEERKSEPEEPETFLRATSVNFGDRNAEFADRFATLLATSIAFRFYSILLLYVN